ncbi:hypothetical protein K493DRAFT_305457 [Basidiobolus meristosporus CBS 931.73]|uniref:REJ domain-containing protein n=1 Tax=Basidiobolus meristosporus CBS 931.73 TaxID=1314790 RepID=A0A1Y1XVM9_9FUNG|nr:hypothetical protein K493DRAFT_305457 [Basidiobolus meristosporus CBS 931.73]|eukprot:ORX89807.1 hypothetical protein K493DRAFT_305457 [Basidiobolus meristosporus CBS 931.73]
MLIQQFFALILSTVVMAQVSNEGAIGAGSSTPALPSASQSVPTNAIPSASSSSLVIPTPSFLLTSSPGASASSLSPSSSSGSSAIRSTPTGFSTESNTAVPSAPVSGAQSRYADPNILDPI